MSKLDQFMQEYETQLAIAVEQYPEEYPWAHMDEVIVGNAGNTVMRKKTVKEVADKMRAAIARNSFSHDGRAFKATCKALGIKHTQKAILAFIAK